MNGGDANELGDRLEREAEELGDRLEREADELERRSEELRSAVRSVDEDWERKRADASVPGAQPEQPEDRSPRERPAS